MVEKSSFWRKIHEFSDSQHMLCHYFDRTRDHWEWNLWMNNYQFLLAKIFPLDHWVQNSWFLLLVLCERIYHMFTRKIAFCPSTVPRTEKLENPQKVWNPNIWTVEAFEPAPVFCWNRAATMCFESSQKFLHFLGGTWNFPSTHFGGWIDCIIFFWSFRIQKLPKVVVMSVLSLGFWLFSWWFFIGNSIPWDDENHLFFATRGIYSPTTTIWENSFGTWNRTMFGEKILRRQRNCVGPPKRTFLGRDRL